MRRKSSTQTCFLVAALALAGSAGCSKSTDGTFVTLNFSGTVDTSQPIRSIVVNLSFPSGAPASTTFQKPSGDITLPTSAALNVQHGEGLLSVSASAMAEDGITVLGTGLGAGTVVRGKTTAIAVVFAHAVPDAGVDSALGFDGPPAGIDGTVDTAASERPIDVPVGLDTESERGSDGGQGDLVIDAPNTGGISGTGGRGAGGAGGMGGAGGILGRGGRPGTGGAVPDASPAVYLLIADPPSADFGVILPGNASPPKGIRIVNKGDAPSPPLSISISDRRTFPISQDGCSGRTLDPGASCTVSFTFAPTVPGPAQADAEVSPAGAPGAKFQLTGTGAGGPATLSLSPTEVHLPPVDVNTMVPVNLTLTNGGDTEAGSITIQVPGAPVFQLTANGCGTGSLGPRSQCPFTVAFAPATFGPASTMVTVSSSLGLSANAAIFGTGRDTVALTIDFKGTGKGTVVGGPDVCPSGPPCTFVVTRTDPNNLPQFVLVAEPNPYNTFDSWSGDCAGQSPCTVVMNTPHQVVASFTRQMATLNLTVLGLAGHTGVLKSPDGNVNCTGSCQGLSLPATDAFQLEAGPGSGSTFAAWTSGPCKGIVPQCTFPLTGTVNIIATFGPRSYMFVSSTTVVPGIVGGLPRADEVCRTLANNAGLPGEYMAWLSSSTEDALKRVGSGGWIRTDGRPFSRDLEALANPTLLTVYYPPRLTEQGSDLGNVRIPVATGSGPDGYGMPGSNGFCKDYRTVEGSLSIGDASSGSSVWSRIVEDEKGCANPQRLYCFRADLNPGPISPAPQNGRRIFVTKGYYQVGGNAPPDELCRKDAEEAGMDPAVFLAFVARTETPAINLVNLAGMPWKRPDGVFIVNQPADLADMKLLAPIDALADGVHYTPASRVWTGASGPTALGTATCGDWRGSSTMNTAIVGDNATSTTPDWFSLPPNVECKNTTTRLMCIERVNPK